ncbi:MAG: copper chaperone PCu(A)C [Chloroflexi bacterium]|nr:copper chaperone PCu(A)C [Chloroflexota bacterium]
MNKFLLGSLVLVFLLSACGTSAPMASKGAIEITASFANAVGVGENSAAFMSIKNNGSEADTLLKASCDAAMMVTIMDSKMEGDVMSMSDVSGIEMPAGSTVELKSGGYHIMLMDLKQELKAGSTISITLEFAKAGKITLDLPVNAIGSMP